MQVEPASLARAEPEPAERGGVDEQAGEEPGARADAWRSAGYARRASKRAKRSPIPSDAQHSPADSSSSLN